MKDKYVYPGTNILINKFNCHDEKELRMIEALSTGGNLAWLQLHPIEGNFDFDHLKQIHHFIFQDLYDWAGQIRDVDIGKNNLFCRAQFINDYAKTVFDDFYSACSYNKNNKDSSGISLCRHERTSSFQGRKWASSKRVLKRIMSGLRIYT